MSRITKFQLDANTGANGRIFIWVDDNPTPIPINIVSRFDFISFSILLTSGPCSYGPMKEITLMRDNI